MPLNVFSCCHNITLNLYNEYYTHFSSLTPWQVLLIVFLVYFQKHTYAISSNIERHVNIVNPKFTKFNATASYDCLPRNCVFLLCAVFILAGCSLIWPVCAVSCTIHITHFRAVASNLEW